MRKTCQLHVKSNDGMSSNSNTINSTDYRFSSLILYYPSTVMFQPFRALIILSVSITICTSQQSGDENCETLPFQLHLIKGFLNNFDEVVNQFNLSYFSEEYDELGRLQRTCDGEVTVNKCEGFCSSQVQPSVITPTGFLKECYCCRESFLRDRVVSLSHCYDPDGIRLMTSEMATMDLRLKEPAECKCYKCGDFSR